MIQEVVDGFKALALSHLMIKSFSVGDNFDIEKVGNIIYPHVFLEYPFNIVYLKGTKTLEFSYYIIDLPSEGTLDYIPLKNKVEIINEDILLRMALKSFNWYSTLNSANSITLSEWMSDNTIAIRTDITLNIDRNSNNCESPFIN